MIIYYSLFLNNLCFIDSGSAAEVHGEPSHHAKQEKIRKLNMIVPLGHWLMIYMIEEKRKKNVILVGATCMLITITVSAHHFL